MAESSNKFLAPLRSYAKGGDVDTIEFVGIAACA